MSYDPSKTDATRFIFSAFNSVAQNNSSYSTTVEFDTSTNITVTSLTTFTLPSDCLIMGDTRSNYYANERGRARLYFTGSGLSQNMMGVEITGYAIGASTPLGQQITYSVNRSAGASTTTLFQENSSTSVPFNELIDFSRVTGFIL